MWCLAPGEITLTSINSLFSGNKEEREKVVSNFSVIGAGVFFVRCNSIYYLHTIQGVRDNPLSLRPGLHTRHNSDCLQCLGLIGLPYWDRQVLQDYEPFREQVECFCTIINSRDESVALSSTKFGTIFGSFFTTSQTEWELSILGILTFSPHKGERLQCV